MYEDNQNTDLTEFDANSLEAPSFVRRGAEAKGVEELHRNVTPPRLILVQKQAKRDLLSRFNPGDLVIMPAGIVVGKFAENSLEEPVKMTPVFHYVEYVIENDQKRWHIEEEGKILERSFDHDGEIAQKALDWSKREEPHPKDEKLTVTYCNRLNYVLLIDHPEFKGMAVYTFKRSGVRQGSDFNGLIQARQSDIFAGIYAMDVRYNEKDGNDWHSVVVSNPPVDSPRWVDNVTYSWLTKENERLKDAFDRRALSSEHDEDEDAVQASAERTVKDKDVADQF